MAPIRWYITCQAMFTFNRYNCTIFDMSGYLPSIQTCLQQGLNRYWQQSQVWHACVVYMLMHAHECECPCVCEFTSTHMTGCPCAGNLSACLPPCLKHGHLLMITVCTRLAGPGTYRILLSPRPISRWLHWNYKCMIYCPALRGC